MTGVTCKAKTVVADPSLVAVLGNRRSRSVAEAAAAQAERPPNRYDDGHSEIARYLKMSPVLAPGVPFYSALTVA